MRDLTPGDKEALVDLFTHPGYALVIGRLVEEEVELSLSAMDPSSSSRDRDSWIREGMGRARTIVEKMVMEVNAGELSKEGKPLTLSIPTSEMTPEMVRVALRRAAARDDVELKEEDDAT